MSTNTETNLELIHEAKITRDCERQKELATHPSFAVRRELARNGHLCQEAAEILGDELEKLRADTKDQVGDTLT